MSFDSSSFGASASSSAALPAEAAAGLSTRWDVSKRHEGTYTDSAAKVQLSPLTGSFLAAWCSGDVSLLHLASGGLLCKVRASGSEDEDDSEAEGDEQFSSFSIAPDEKSLATVSRKTRLIQIWDISAPASGVKELASWKAAHALPVLDLAFSPSGAELASCAADKSIIVYSVARPGTVTHRFAPSAATPAAKPGHKSRVVHLQWHPQIARAQLLSCAEDGEMRLWSLKDNSSVLLANHMSLVSSTAFTRDGQTLLSGGRDKVVNVWSMAEGAALGKHLRTLPVYESVEGLAILSARPSCVAPAAAGSKAETYFTTAGSKGSLRTWALSTLECVYTKDLPTAAATAASSGASDSLSARNAAKYIANQIAHLLLIPARKAQTASVPSGDASSSLLTAATPATEERLIAVTAEQNFYLYSASSFRRLQLLLGFNDEIIDLKFHPDSRHLLLASNSSQIRLLDTQDFKADLLSGHTDTVLAIDVSPCGQFVVSSSKDNTVRFWKLELNQTQEEEASWCVAIGEGHTESVGCVSFNRNKHTGGKLFAVSGARERIMKLWDCSSSTFKNHKRGEAPIKLVASCSKLAHEKDINCVEISPNDKLVASGSEDKNIRLWSSVDLASIAVLKGHRRGVWCVRFSPVDKVLASASGDKTIKIWSMGSGTGPAAEGEFQCLKTMEGHTASVKQLAFINAGMQLLSCGDDSVVKLWTLKTSECVSTFSEAHTGKIWSLAVNAAGTLVATGGSDSTLNLWQDVSASDIESASALKEGFLLQEQQLSNLIRSGRFEKAVELTLELEQPRKCYTIVQEIMQKEQKTKRENEARAAVAIKAEKDSDEDEDDEEEDEPVAPTESILPRIVSSLSDALLSRLILYIRDWNTHAKSSGVAQRLLSELLHSIPASRLHSTRTLLHQLQNLLLYSERHFVRIEKLLTKSFLMDHMLAQMHTVEPQAMEREAAAREVRKEAGRVLQTLLGSSEEGTAGEEAEEESPFAPRSAEATAATAMDEDEEEEGFSDDDGSAWATNWQEPSASAPAAAAAAAEEPKKAQTQSKSSKVKQSPSLAPKPAPVAAAAAAPATTAAGKNKRKEPAAAAAAPAVPASKTRASPALAPAAAPAAAASAASGKKKKKSKV